MLPGEEPVGHELSGSDGNRLVRHARSSLRCARATALQLRDGMLRNEYSSSTTHEDERRELGFL